MVSSKQAKYLLSSISSSPVSTTVLSGHRTSVLNCGWSTEIIDVPSDVFSAEEKLVVAFPRIPSLCLVPGEIIQ